MSGSATAVVQRPEALENEALFFRGPEAFVNASGNSAGILDFSLVTP